MSLRCTRCRPTHQIPAQCWASVTAHCWFNTDKLSTTLAQHYSNIGSAVYLAAAPQQTRAIHPILFQCWPNFFDVEILTLKQHWVIVLCLLRLLFGWRSSPHVARKNTTQITDLLAQCWCNAGPSSVSLNQHYSNRISLSLITNIIVTIFVFLALFKQATILPSDLKSYIRHVHIHNDWSSEISNVFATRHPPFRKLGHKHYSKKLKRFLASGWP